jgi:Phage portal protein
VSKRSGRGRTQARGNGPRAQQTATATPAHTSPPPVPASPVGKGSTRTTASRTPVGIDAGLHRSGMDSSASMGPGRPVSPYQGYSQPPRAMDYPVGVNIAIRTRASWGLASFEILRALIRNYDVARICIDHKIDELRSMDLMLLPADGIRGDVDDAIDAARAVLEFPDRELPYLGWLSKLMENALKFDATPLYRRRDMNGDVIGLEILDGTTVMPYIDERGRRPKGSAPAYYQIVHGQVWNWYTDQDISYEMFRPQEDSPFGTAPMEALLLTANTDIRFQWHFLQMFTEGSVPAGFIEVPPDVSSPNQVAEWQDYWDAMLLGDQAKLHQLLAVPAGTKVTNTRPESFDPTFPEYLMSRTCAKFGVVPQDAGLVKDVNRSNGETQTDIQFRVNTLPWVYWIEGILTRYLRRDIGLPVKAKLNTGRDKEDRVADAQAWKIYVDSGMASPDEGRSELLGLPVDNLRPTPRFFNNTRLGPIPLLAIEGVSGKTDPETHGPAADQPAVDAPYIGPVGIIPQAGTVDAAQDLAAQDAYQVQSRAGMLASEGVPPTTFPTAAVAKSASAAELRKFRAFRANRLDRGKWNDFEFHELGDPEIAAFLNAEGRAAVAKAGADGLPKAPRSAKDWPGWDRDLATAAHYSARIRADLTAGTDAAALARGWLGARNVAKAAAPVPGQDDAARFLYDQGTLVGITGILNSAYGDMAAEGWVIGSRAATSLLGGGPVDWGGWTPGDPAAADLVLGADGAGAGLAALLSDANITIKSLGQGRFDDMARALALSLENGDSADTLARDLRDILDNASWAEGVAITEIARAVSAGSMDVYRTNGVGWADWLDSNDVRVCPTCDDNAANGPYPIDAFPTMPDHPRCRCAPAPAADPSTGAIASDAAISDLGIEE